jgi:hypothetical protein
MMRAFYIRQRPDKAGRRAPGWVAGAFLFLAVCGSLAAQTSALSGINPLGRGGFQLYNITGFAGWESVVSPQGGFYLPATTGLKGDGNAGGGATVGWSKRSKKYNFSMVYNASYQAQFRYTNLSALSQSLSMSGSRQLGSKWNLGFAGATGISTYDQMLFSPTVFGSLAAVPSTFDDLASAVLTGKYNNDQ